MIALAFKISIFLSLLTIGMFLFFGYIYSIIEKINFRYLISTFGSIGILLTGIIGTTVHELGHLIMCFIFNHKINSFQFFNFKNYKSESTLGYVSHKYNEKSLYQKAGNFFIGIGPIISGTLFMILSFKFLLPNKFSLLNMDNYLFYLSNINIENFILLFINLFKILFKALFSIDNLNNIKFYIFIYLMICVSTHISLICIMLNLNSILIIFINCLLYLSIFLTIGLIFSIVSLGIVFLLSLIN